MKSVHPVYYLYSLERLNYHIPSNHRRQRRWHVFWPIPDSGCYL